MKNFEYNWATAEMMKMYLRNSRAQEKRKARKAAGVPAIAQDTSAVDPGLATTSNATQESSDNSSDSDSEDDE